MNINRDEFFREATLRICGSLDIEKALHECLLYVRDFIPADVMSLQVFDPDMGSLETVAVARPEGGEALSIKTPMPSEALKSALEKMTMPRLAPEAHIAESLGESQETEWLRQHLNIPVSAGLFIVLALDSESVGAFFVTKEGQDVYTDEHARLMVRLNEPVAIALSNYLRYREVLELKNILADDNRYLHNELQRLSGDEIVGADFGLKRVMNMVQQVAPLDSPVLLLGETGTGKEVIAGAIHKASPRREGPFIKVNCGAIPENLMDSELFGHEKGAFTGALTMQRGRFERAHGGTIFLDEIGELSQEAQVRLLRVLQDREIERVGGGESMHVDIRVIAATHRDLDSMMAEGSFREDLYFRLRVFPILIPPLRDRKADITALVHHFIHKKTREMGLRTMPVIGSAALDRLTSYSWPGNVRELEHAVERALILDRGGPLNFEDLNPQAYKNRSAVITSLEDDPLELDYVISRHINRVMDAAGGRVNGPGGAAEMLRLNPSTLRQKMRKLGIPFGRKTSF